MEISTRINEISRVRDEYLVKSSRLYAIFYTLLGLSTLFAGIGQLLIYEEKHYVDMAGRLDLAAMVFNFMSTVILQILAISGIKAIAHNLNRVGRLLNVYLSPFVTSEEQVVIMDKVIELSQEIETFWVSLPRFGNDTFHEALLSERPTQKRVDALLVQSENRKRSNISNTRNILN